MVDYYGLPKSGDRAWPGREAETSLPGTEKASRVEDALFDDIGSEMGSGFNANRFVPYVVMHEFEGLLFSDCTAFARGLGRPEMQAAFQEIRQQFATPEEIDDSPTTAPSKRVERLIAGYDKPLVGTLAALQIGVSKISPACPHFPSWLASIGQLVRSSR